MGANQLFIGIMESVNSLQITGENHAIETAKILMEGPPSGNNLRNQVWTLSIVNDCVH